MQYNEFDDIENDIRTTDVAEPTDANRDTPMSPNARRRFLRQAAARQPPPHSARRD